MSNLKVQPGDRLTANRWNAVVDRLPAPRFASASSTPDSPLSIKVLAENSTGGALTLGDIGKLGTYQGPTDAHEQLNQPLYTVTAAAFPGVLDFPAVAAEDIPSGEIGSFGILGLVAVKFSSTSGSSPLAEIDPANPSQVKRGSGGIGRVLHAATPVGQIMLTGMAGHTFWRYTLNEAMGATTANQAAADLLDMGGTDTSSDVTILDPLAMFSDQVLDSAGYCVQVGAVYYAIQAPCA